MRPTIRLDKCIFGDSCKQFRKMVYVPMDEFIAKITILKDALATTGEKIKES